MHNRIKFWHNLHSINTSHGAYQEVKRKCTIRWRRNQIDSDHILILRFITRIVSGRYYGSHPWLPTSPEDVRRRNQVRVWDSEPPALADLDRPLWKNVPLSASFWDAFPWCTCLTKRLLVLGATYRWRPRADLTPCRGTLYAPTWPLDDACWQTPVSADSRKVGREGKRAISAGLSLKDFKLL